MTAIDWVSLFSILVIAGVVWTTFAFYARRSGLDEPRSDFFSAALATVLRLDAPAPLTCAPAECSRRVRRDGFRRPGSALRSPRWRALFCCRGRRR